jgi:hypothetical protein
MYTSLLPILVWVLILAVAALAWVQGNRPERFGAVFVLVAALAAIAVHIFVPGDGQAVFLLADEALLAIAFLALAMRYTSVWLGAAMILQAIQFSLLAYYLIGERPHDRLYATVNNANTLGVLLCILVGTLLAWRKRDRAAK